MKKEDKKMFIKNLMAKLSKCKSQIDSLQAKADQIDIQSRARYSTTIMEIVGKIQQTEKKLQMINKSLVNDWQTLKQEAENAWLDLDNMVKMATKEHEIQR